MNGPWTPCCSSSLTLLVSAHSELDFPPALFGWVARLERTAPGGSLQRSLPESAKTNKRTDEKSNFNC